MLALAGCGGADERPAPTPPPDGLALGLAEQNPHLVAPGAAPAGFAAWRDRSVALRPSYFRLLVHWASVQPVAGRPADWTVAADGCLRGAPPCAPYAGVRDRLRAIRARQREDPGWRLVVSFHGPPPWALEPRGGCPDGGAVDLDAYAALLRSFRALAEAEGVQVHGWSAWNEPNHPSFLAPQRARCDPDAPAVSPRSYAALARVALEERPAGARLVLGEAAGYDRPRPDAVDAAALAAALPRDIACATTLWGQHAYVGRGSGKLAADRDVGGHQALVDGVLAALDGHGCRRRHSIWITETGARPGPDACRAMHRALRTWWRMPRVDAAFQYTLREDTAFPVGLADAALTRELPAYRAWRAWAGGRDAAAAPPADLC